MEILQQVKEHGVLNTGGNYLKKAGFITFSFSMVFVLVLFLPIKSSAESPEVKIEDSALEKVIRHELNKNEGPLTVGDMENLKKIGPADWQGITTLNGLEYAIPT
ncbi:hypothetical protein [Paenibacillus sp. RC84]|uniref:hypothetical protein n=1 Tax=Paenibacillus sp. RC84 TaxID=3156252 RepID=UPI0035193502